MVSCELMKDLMPNGPTGLEDTEARVDGAIAASIW